MVIPFDRFIETKPLYYKEIDHERIYHAYELLSPKIRHPKAIHIVGTNGKGSTGRMIAHLAYCSGLHVGHFSSPHIMKFNERIWIDGVDIDDHLLEFAHQKLYALLGSVMSDALSYFEYTTLLALVAFEELDIIVLEAGLGGEFDATNICDKVLSVITPIGIDHQSFLGESIEEIASTKIRSVQKELLIAPQSHPQVVQIAQEIAHSKQAKLHLASHKKEREKLLLIAKSKQWGSYLIENAQVAIQALDIVGIKYEIDDLLTVEIFGRYYPLTSHIRIDVGHNTLAAQAIAKTLDKPVALIYNSLDDKEYKEILRGLKPHLKRVEIIPIHTQRSAATEKIIEALESLDIPYREFDGTIEENEEYLVFGSFYVVEEFLKLFSTE